MATRFYYEATNTPPVSPAFGSGYASTAVAVRRNLVLAKAATTESRTGSLADVANDNDLIVQLVSAPLAGNQTITGTYSLVSRGKKGASTDVVNKRWRRVAVVSNDGSTVRAEILAPGPTSSTTSLSATTLQGQQHATAGAVGTVNALDGDRIVIELGYGQATAGTTSQWEMILGGTGTDHANSNGDVSGTVPWSEFSQNLTFQSGDVTGTLATTLADATLAASGTETISGTLATTLAGATLAGSGAETISGTLAATLAGATLAATGSSGNDVTGTLAATLTGATLAASGIETISGALASTLTGATLAGSGLVANPVIGTLAVTLGGATMVAAGTETIPGTLAATLDGITLASAGLVSNPVTGTLTVTLADATLAVAAAVTGLTAKATSAPAVATGKASSSNAGASNTSGAAVSSSRSSTATVTRR